MAPLLCIMGPTASGKTELAIAAAQDLGGELISVDSALVYRGLDIGSAKPAYPHHLVDICDPAEIYSAARFASDAQRTIEAIRARGRRPILVGGTMLYYRALLDGLAPMPAADPDLRVRLAERAAKEGWPALHAELARRDPEAAARIHPNHSQRLLRALELSLLTGRCLDELHSRASERARPDTLCIAIAPHERHVLHRRIAARFEAMLAAGFLDEVRALHARSDLHPRLPAIRAVGYRQLWGYLDGEYDLDEAVTRAVAATRQLAKRQFTWLRKWSGLQWILTDEGGGVVPDSGTLGARAPGSRRGRDPAELLLNYLRRGPIV